MFVGFIGPPCSGKTTVAAQVFAELKRNSYPLEFIAERARWYIAQQKVDKGFVNLGDWDQVLIMEDQDRVEEVFCKSAPKSVIISDSCVLNSIFYMSKEIGIPVQAAERYTKASTKLFYCPVLPEMDSGAANRVHSFEEARIIGKHMEEYLSSWAVPVIPLYGTVPVRVSVVVQEIYNSYWITEAK
jgi:predicted ATPase